MKARNLVAIIVLIVIVAGVFTTWKLFNSNNQVSVDDLHENTIFQNISLKNNYNSKIREVNYITHDSYRLWYSTLEQIGNNSNTLLVNTTNESLTKNID